MKNSLLILEYLTHLLIYELIYPSWPFFLVSFGWKFDFFFSIQQLTILRSQIHGDLWSSKWTKKKKCKEIFAHDSITPWIVRLVTLNNLTKFASHVLLGFYIREFGPILWVLKVLCKLFLSLYHLTDLDSNGGLLNLDPSFCFAFDIS